MEAGRLLLAVPGMLDPHFDATVVFIFDEGAAGVILNRPTELPLAAAVPEWEHLAADPAVVFWGGPVQEEAAVALAVPPPPRAEPVGAGVGLVDLRRGAEDAGHAASVRIFAGYAGWEPGQLETEIAQGGWFVVPAQSGDVVSPDPSGLWRNIFGRQKGWLRRYRTYPDDPGLN